MLEIITAVYEDGVLRPLEPLNLAEHQTVRLQVLADETSETKRVIKLLTEAGLITPRLGDEPPPDPVSAAERQRLAAMLSAAPGKPLTEMVIEDRGEW